MFHAWIFGGKFASRLDFGTANIFADGANVVVEPLGVICAMQVDFPNNRVFHNHASILPSIPAEWKFQDFFFQQAKRHGLDSSFSVVVTSAIMMARKSV
jgi:hypothetical protein